MAFKAEELWVGGFAKIILIHKLAEFKTCLIKFVRSCDYLEITKLGYFVFSQVQSRNWLFNRKVDQEEFMVSFRLHLHEVVRAILYNARRYYNVYCIFFSFSGIYMSCIWGFSRSWFHRQNER